MAFPRASWARRGHEAVSVDLDEIEHYAHLHGLHAEELGIVYSRAVPRLSSCQRDPEGAVRLGNAGRALVEREFSVESSAKKLADVFHGVSRE